jgi:putative ABC transport system permease protein
MLVEDMKHAFRRLLSRPGATFAPVAMLGIGIGLTTAMFTLVDTLILRPVPFSRPDELAHLYMGDERGGRTSISPAAFQAWRESPAFARVESAHQETALVEAAGIVAARPVAWVTPGLFAMLGDVRPVRGRLFASDEGRAGSDDRVLLSESVWRGLFNADPTVVGRRITVAGDSVLVVGVLPADFRFPTWKTALWRPIAFDASSSSHANRRPTAYVRFASNMPRADALRLATDAARGADGSNAALRATPRAVVTVEAYARRAAPLLTGGVIFVFLVLCINVCGLQLTGVTARRREFSVRAAVGASPGRLMSQAFVESSVLCVLGTLTGIVLAWLLVQLLRALLPEAYLMHTLNPPSLDRRALAITVASGAIATLAVGLWPAWMGRNVDAIQAMRVGERGGTEARSGRLLMRLLLIGEVALACTLLVTATLLARSFVNLVRVDRGLNTDDVIAATMTLPKSAFPDPMARRAAALSIEEAIRRLPGVQAVAWSYGIPPEGGAFSSGKWTSDVAGAPSVETTVDRYNVGTNFFSFYAIPIVRGRALQPTDSEHDVVIGERLAQMLWPGLEPIGRTFGFGSERFQVIGVAREIRYPSLETSLDKPEMYHHLGGVGSYVTIGIRCHGKCPDEGVLRQRVLAEHAGITVMSVRPLEEAYLEQLARPRAAAGLGAVFALTALVVTGGGLFCLLTVAVGRRQREFGIRVALGASPALIGRLVWREGLIVLGLGAVIGVIGAASFARVISSLHYGVTIGDPLTWGIVLGVLSVVTVVASWRPTRQALRVSPSRLLNQE